MLASFPRSKPLPSSAAWPPDRRGEHSSWYQTGPVPRGMSCKGVHSDSCLTLTRFVGGNLQANHFLNYDCPLVRGCPAGQAPGICLSVSGPGSDPRIRPRSLPGTPVPLLSLSCCSHILAGSDQVVIFLHDPFSIFLHKKGINCTWLQ